jgi:hypothetical protein
MSADIWDFGPLVPYGDCSLVEEWIEHILILGQPGPIRCYEDSIGQYHPYAAYDWQLIALCVAGVTTVKVNK